MVDSYHRKGYCRYCHVQLMSASTCCNSCAKTHLHTCMCLRAVQVIVSGRKYKLREKRPLPDCNTCGGKGWYYD